MAWTSSIEQTGTNLENIGLEKVQTTSKSIAPKSSPEFREITPSRCKARKRRDDFYYDPVTFVATDARVDTVFDDLGSPISENVDRVDKVLSDACLPNAADQKSPRSVDYWSSYFHPFVKRMALIKLNP